MGYDTNNNGLNINILWSITIQHYSGHRDFWRVKSRQELRDHRSEAGDFHRFPQLWDDAERELQPNFAQVFSRKISGVIPH